MKEKKQWAFTLIEMMIAVAIVGILAAVAYPSYKQHIDHSKESEAQTALISLAVAMSQLYLDNNTYFLNGAAPSAENVFSAIVPVSGGTKTYDLAISSVTDTTFTITATPVESDLATYTLDELGNKTATDNGVTQDYWD